MDFTYLHKLRRTHAAWRLLAAESAPLVASFLHFAFVQNNLRSLRENELLEKLKDYLLHLRSSYGENMYPRSASDYLEEWSDQDHNWLRKYYPQIGDEPEYDLTPAAEKAIEWLESLEKKEFVGTESRLLLIFQMLRDLVQATEQDTEKRIDELTKRKQEIEAEIVKVRQGLGNNFDTRQIKENFWRIEEEIRRLMFDFREVEENFRELDRQTREHIATSSQVKSEVLDKIFQEQDSIEQSEQGRSFMAFWQFLMSTSRQVEMEQNISRLASLTELQPYQNQSALQNLKYNLLDAGDKTKRTLSGINEQLRSFLQERKWLENRRILEIIRGIEEKAIHLRNDLANPRHWHSMADLRPSVKLPMERTLYMPGIDQVALPENLIAGLSEAPEALFHTFYVDEQRLRSHIRESLAHKTQMTLQEITEIYPIQQGLSEIIMYLVLASRNEHGLIDTSQNQKMIYAENTFDDDEQFFYTTTIPLAIFSKGPW